MPWRRERLPTTVFWPGGFHGQYSPRGHKESDTTKRLSLSHLKTVSPSLGGFEILELSSSAKLSQMMEFTECLHHFLSKKILKRLIAK